MNINALLQKSASRHASTVGVAALALSLVSVGVQASGTLPSFKVEAAPELVSPSTADAYYCQHSCNTSGTVDLWANGYPPEITSLAAGLRKNVDLIYEYVHDNIDLVPMYGLQKGALGALIDHSGTAFDQAQLMVDLLRASGYSASYKAGTVTLDGTQINNWLGVTDAASLAKILADGGIPATVSPASGTVSSVTLAHVWVQVTIDGSQYVFDPAFKSYKITAPINFKAATGYNDSNFFAGAQSGANWKTGVAASSAATGSVAAPWVQGPNNASLQASLTTYANNLISYLKANNFSSNGQSIPLASGQIDDLIGRHDIVPASVPGGSLRQTTLPYPSVVQHSWSLNIPDAYRTTLAIDVTCDDQSGQLCNGSSRILQREFFVDEFYGRRVALDVTQDRLYVSYTTTLTVDHQPVLDAYGNALTFSSGNYDYSSIAAPILLSVNHPYAAANGNYMDQTEALGNSAQLYYGPQQSTVLVTGFGDTSLELLAKWSSEQSGDNIGPSTEDPIDCIRNEKDWNCDRQYSALYPSEFDYTLSKVAADWLAEYTRQAQIQARMGGAIIQNHHVLGVAYSNGGIVHGNGLTLDIDSAISINSTTGDANARRALTQSVAAAADTLEGSIFEQQLESADPMSVSSRFGWAEESNANTFNNFGPGTVKYYLLSQNSQNNADYSALFPTVQGHYLSGSMWTSGGILQSYLGDNSLSGLGSGNYQLIVADNPLLGPGYERVCTIKQPLGGCTSDRGQALQAFGTAGNSYAVANVISQAAIYPIKGGGSGAGPAIPGDYDPTGAAQLLKDKFKDRSNEFGVNLKSGAQTFAEPPAIVDGNGSFPYSLSYQRTFHSGSGISSPGEGIGWTNNLDVRLTMGSNGMATMGDGPAVNAATALVAFYVTQQTYYSQPQAPANLLARWIMGPFIQHWWAEQILFNTVTRTSGDTNEQFVRLPYNPSAADSCNPCSWSYNPPKGYIPTDGSPYTVLQQYGQPSQPTKAEDDGYLQTTATWSASGMGFNITSPTNDRQNFGLLLGGLGDGFNWALSTWTFPTPGGSTPVTVNYTYAGAYDLVVDKNGYTQSGVITGQLASVSTSLGRKLTFGIVQPLGSDVVYTAGGTQRTIGTVADENGRVAQTPIAQLVFDPGTVLSTLDTIPGELSDGLPRMCPTAPGHRPQCYPVLTQVYWNSDTAHPKSVYGYDALWRVNSYQDGTSALQSMGGSTPYADTRGAYQFYITGSSRGERMDPAGYSYTAYYDAWGRTTEFVDELGRSSTATYDGLDRVLSRTAPLGDTTQMSYDPQGHVLSMTSTPASSPAGQPAQLTVTATYDPHCGKIASLVDAWGNTAGANPASHTTTWNYDPSTCLLNWVKQPSVKDGVSGTSQRPWTQYFYNSVGLKQKVIDPTGLEVDYTYDNDFNLSSRIVDPSGKNLVTQYLYDGSTTLGAAGAGPGNITRVIDPNGKATDYSWDIFRRVTAAWLSNATDGSCWKSENLYGNNGLWELQTQTRSAKVCNPDESATSASNDSWAVTTTQYTGSSKPWIVTDPSSYEALSKFDADDRVTDAIACLNPGSGNSCPTGSITGTLQRDTHSEYNPDGTVAAVYKGWGAPGQITYARYTYSDEGQVLTTTDADNNVTTTVYDGYGRLWRTCFADSSGSCDAAPTDYEESDYDPTGAGNNGEVTSHRNRDGKTLTFSFDTLNREITRNVPANAAGHFKRTLTTSYDLASRKWSETVVDTETGTSTTQTLQNGFDSAMRLTSVNDSLLNTLGNGGAGGTAGNLTWDYDNASNRTSLAVYSVNGSLTVRYGYDDAERLHSITNGSNVLATYADDPLSRVKSVTFGDTTEDDYGWQDNGDLTSLTAGKYSGAGVTYGYTSSGAHQLIGKTVNNNYYEMRSTTDGQSYSVNNLNQYTSINGVSQSYDPNGNLTGTTTSVGNWTLEYDEENRLRLATGPHTVLYDYDPQGRRRSKTVDGTVTWFASDGPNEVAEYNYAGARQRIYVNGDGMDERVAVFTASGALWDYYHIDHQNSTLFTSENGAINTANRYRYGPYGESTDSLTGNPIRYTGRYLDAETGLYYYRARFYNPDTGRFLQTDPIGSKDDLDLYAYTGGDPVNKTDPTGLCVPVCLALIPEALEVGGAALTALESSGVVEAGVEAAGGLINAARAGLAGTALAKGIQLDLKYKAGWTTVQKAAADAKVAKIDAAAKKGEVSVAGTIDRSGKSARDVFKEGGGQVKAGEDVDHTVDRQLNGSNTFNNLGALDSSVNKSLGAQVRQQIKGAEPGTPITGCTISETCTGGGAASAATSK